MAAMLEHVNISVTDAKATSALLCTLFDWEVRWEGASSEGGYTVHVGSDDAYLAVYSLDNLEDSKIAKYAQRGGLNHVGVVVSDLEETERRVSEAGFQPHSHMDYEPGRRFYFQGPDGIEIEVVNYG